jgi:uncharacterized protein
MNASVSLRQKALSMYQTNVQHDETIVATNPQQPPIEIARSVARVLTAPDPPPLLTNDCACPDAPFHMAAVPAPNGRFICTPDTVLSDLPHGYTMAFSPLAPQGPCVLSPAALQRWQTFSQPQARTESIDEELAAQQLIQLEGQPFVPEAGRPTTLTAWLHVTNACNLDCPYCYVRKSSARMSLADGQRAIEQIITAAQKHKFQHIKLKYAGGEATLHMRLVRELHAYAQHLSSAAQLRVSEVLLSNGVALRSKDADWIAQASINLMISLDGVGKAHDAQRPTRRGAGSFAAIEHTVDHVLMPRGIRPDITITITRQNALDAADAVRWALQRDLPVSLNFYRQPPNLAVRADLMIEEQAIIEGMRRAYRVFEEVMPTRSHLNGLLDRAQAQAHTHTCGVGLAYVVVSHEGKIAQCQMHMNDSIDVQPGDDIITLVAQGPIQNISVDQKEGCRNCAYRYRCAGGCPIETFRATGRWDIRSPHCQIYQSLFPEALRLEGLRILKIHGFLH